MRTQLVVAVAHFARLATLSAQPLTAREAGVRTYLSANFESGVSLLQRAVNIPSGTFNTAGVRAVGALYRQELDALGFATKWVELPPALRRAGHLVAEWNGAKAMPATKRLLLIGHLDTVFEGPGQRFARRDTVARGAGTADMKGGDVAIIMALRALKAVGALDELKVTVIMTGDEEAAGRPLSASRKTLTELARVSDAALAFEGGDARTATISRRGASGWILTAKGRQGHSSAIFRDGSGYGAVFEAARILNEFRERLGKERYLTFNPGTIVGGTTVRYDSAEVNGTASGKTNIIAKDVVVQGDLRFLTDGQLDSARAAMRAIVADHLPGTTASISFDDGYPGMPPTDGNRALLNIFDQTSQALGYPAVDPLPPEQRGAGDVSFVGGIIPSLDGLGVAGFGAHSPEEGVYLPSLTMAALRAAVFMMRLSRGPEVQ